MDNGEFERLEIAPFSNPPDMPYVVSDDDDNNDGDDDDDDDDV